MSKANQYETDILDLLFTTTAIADVAENDSSSPLTNLYVSLHTGDVGEAGNQGTNECAYSNYARVEVVRTGSGWTVAAGACENAAIISFPTSGNGPESATHFAVGSLTSGTGKVFYKGALDATLVINNGVTPKFAAGDLDVTED